MSLTSRLGFGLALSLIAGLGAPIFAPAILSNHSTKNSFASSFAQTQTAQAQIPAFSDVSTDHWAYDYIEGLAKLNIISGFPDGTFKPNDPVTRAQFAAILRQAFLQSQRTTAQSFKDVPASYWGANSISAARSAGFLSGYPDNTFKPNDRILRVQALVSLANGLKYPASDPQSLSNYKDADTVPAYARPSTAAAAQANLVVSYPAPDQISPNRAASRAEVAAFVYQALVKAGRVNPIAAKPERRWQMTPITTIEAAHANTFGPSLSKDGQRLAAITDLSSKIQVWNTQTGSLLRTVTTEAPNSAFSAIAISKDGTKIAFVKTTESTGAIQLTVQTVEDGEVLLTKSLNPPQNQLPRSNYPIKPSRPDVAFSPDGKQIITKVRLEAFDPVVDNTIYNHLDFRSITTGEVTQSIDLMTTTSASSFGSTFSPDGSLLARISDSANVDIWKRNSNNRFDYLTVLPISKDEASSIDIAFTNSNLLNIVTYKSSQLRLDTWNPQTVEQVQSTVLPNEECIIDRGGGTPSPDGVSYFSSYPNLGACFGNIQTGEFQRNLDGLSVELEASVFSGNGDVIAVAGESEIRIFTKAAP